MYIQYNIEEIERLKKILALNKRDTDVMNKLAIAYLDNDQAYYIAQGLFKRAYKLNPSIKTANNYACLLIVQDWLFEEGIEILQPFIESNPKSDIPYNLIAYAYLRLEKYKIAAEYFEKAKNLSRSPRVEILHNLAYCKNNLGQTQEALELYNQAIQIQDDHNESKYNAALCKVELGLDFDLDQLIEFIRNSDAYKQKHVWISNIQLSMLCYFKGKYKKAYELMLESNELGILGFPEFSFLLLKYNKYLYDELKKQQIEKNQEYINELYDTEDEDYEDYTEEERFERIQELKEEINTILYQEARLTRFPKDTKPIDLYEYIFCGCMYFDCKKHGNQFDD